MEKIDKILKTINFAEQEQSLNEAGAIISSNTVSIAIGGADDMLRRGLNHFVGDTARWLKEYDQIADWLTDNHGKGLLCIGNCGRGKTLMCCKIIPCITRYWANKLVYCYTANELGQRLKDAKAKKLLCIDDIGTEGVYNSYGNKVYAFPEIVDDAERTGKLLLVTTNMSYDELKVRYGERTVDRLIGMCRVVPFDGDSLRGQ